MLIEKYNLNIEGASLFLTHNSIAIDVFIKKNGKNFSDVIDFYSRTSRVTIKVNYNNWESSLLFFEEKNKDSEFFLLQKVNLKNFLKRGNAIVFNPIPTLLSNSPTERKKEFFTNLSFLNNEDIEEGIDYKNIIEVFLRNNLKVKNQEIIRFESIE